MEAFNYEAVAKKFPGYDEEIIIQCILETGERLGLTPSEIISTLLTIVKEVGQYNLLESLPYEKILEIAMFIPDKSLLAFCLSSKKLAKVCADEAFWRMKTKNRFGKTKFGPYNESKTWKEEYEFLSTRIIATADHSWFTDKFLVVYPDKVSLISREEERDIDLIKQLDLSFRLTGLGPDRIIMQSGTVQNLYNTIYAIKIPEPEHVIFDGLTGGWQRLNTFRDLFKLIGTPIWSDLLGQFYYEYPDSFFVLIKRLDILSEPTKIYLQWNYVR